MNRIATFNPRAQEVIDAPYPYYQEYRSVAPVHFGAPLFSQIKGSWYFFCHEDIQQILASDKVGKLPDGEQVDIIPPLFSSFRKVISEWLVFNDPPNHQRMRSVLNQSFSGRNMKKMELAIAEMTEALIMEIKHKEKIEFIADFALPLPIRVICRLLGLPKEDRSRFEALSQSLLDAGFSARDKTPEVFEKAEHAMRGLMSYFEEVIARKAQNPGSSDDLIDVMLRAVQAGELSHSEMIANCIHVLNAGYETTIHLLSKGTLALLKQPELLQESQETPNGWAQLVEELLRYDSPVQMVTRWSKQEMELGGIAIPAGNCLCLMLGAANRDPAVFENPDDLMLNRPRMHLAFGGGIHYCLGSSLARLEAKIAFQQLAACIPRWQIDSAHPNPLQYNSSIVFHGLKAMHLKQISQ